MEDRRQQAALGRRHDHYLATCSVCGERYPAEQNAAEYCSSRCRAKAWRARRANAGERDRR
jgi:predicted nucleic acid-binding Zn ribbon protein